MILKNDGTIVANTTKNIVHFETVAEYDAWVDTLPNKEEDLDKFIVRIGNKSGFSNKALVIQGTSGEIKAIPVEERPTDALYFVKSVQYPELLYWDPDKDPDHFIPISCIYDHEGVLRKSSSNLKESIYYHISNLPSYKYFQSAEELGNQLLGVLNELKTVGGYPLCYCFEGFYTSCDSNDTNAVFSHFISVEKEGEDFYIKINGVIDPSQQQSGGSFPLVDKKILISDLTLANGWLIEDQVMNTKNIDWQVT